MITLRQWGQKYGAEFVVEDPVLVDQQDRLPIGPVSILAHDGRILSHEDLWLVKRADLGKRADGSTAQYGVEPATGDLVDIEAAKEVAAG